MGIVSSTNFGELMEQNVFELFRDRFDAIEQQNADQLTLLREHIKESDAVSKVVERHSAYFGLMGLGMTPIIGWVAYKLGIKH